MLTARRREVWIFRSVGAILTSWRQSIWGHFHLLRFVRSEGRGGVGFRVVFELEAGLRKLVMGGVDGGRKGSMPLMFQE